MAIVVGSAASVTALDVLKRSLRMLGVYSLGETPSADETSDGMLAFNALIGTLSNGQMVYEKTLDAINLTAGQSSVTVGPSGTVATSRPVRVRDESYILYQGVSYPLTVVSLQQYNDIAVKTSQGLPMVLWVQPDMPNVTVTLWPVPSADMTLNLWSDKALTGTLSATTVLSFPPGYEDAFAYLLAEAIAPEYEATLSREMQVGVARSRRLLKRTNMQVPRLKLDVPGMFTLYDPRTGV